MAKQVLVWIHAGLVVAALRGPAPDNCRPPPVSTRLPDGLPRALERSADFRVLGENANNRSHLEKEADRLDTWPDCALVSGSVSLLMKGLGAQIDAHYPVIRINRLPLSRYFYKDFGQRTDIVFGNGYESRAGAFTQMGYPTQTCAYGTSDPRCAARQEHCARGGPSCPSIAVLFENMDNASACLWRGSPVPVGSVRKDLLRAAHSLRFPGSLPSAGYYAFFAFLPVCERITLYGFIGKHSADGHTMDKRHNFKGEHKLYELMAQGRLTEEDLELAEDDMASDVLAWLPRELLTKRPVLVTGNEAKARRTPARRK